MTLNTLQLSLIMSMSVCLRLGLTWIVAMAALMAWNHSAAFVGIAVEIRD